MSRRAGPRDRPRAVITPPEIAMSAAKTSAAVPTVALRITVSNTMRSSLSARMLHARARPIVRHARALVEPAVIEALHHGEHLARESAARVFLGCEGRAERRGELRQHRLLVDPCETPVAQHDLARHHHERDAGRLRAMHDGVDDGGI